MLSRIAKHPSGLLLGAQLLAIAGCLILFVILYLQSAPDARRSRSISQGDRMFVAAIALGPLVLALLMQAVAGLRFRDMWGAPMWCFTGLLLMVATEQRTCSEPALKRLGAALAAIVVVLIGARAGADTLGPAIGRKPDRVQFPAAELARRIERGWHERMGPERRLDIVIADLWLGGMMTAYAAEHPAEMIDGSRVKSPWITCDRLKQNGAVILWRPEAQGEDPPVLKGFPDASLQDDIEIPYGVMGKTLSARLKWATLPPGQNDCPAAETSNLMPDEPGE